MISIAGSFFSSTLSLFFEVVASLFLTLLSFADLVLVLDALFYAQSQRPTGEAITSDEVKNIIKLYEHGKKKEAGAGVFRRDLVHAKLGKANISTFNVSFLASLSSRSVDGSLGWDLGPQSRRERTRRR